MRKPENEWDEVELGDVLQRVRKPVEVDPLGLYREIGIRSHGKGLFYKEERTGESLGTKAVFWVEPHCFVVNIVFAWEQAVAKTTARENGMIASHRFPMYKPLPGRIDLDYLLYFFQSPRGKYLLGLASPGGAGRNKTLGQEAFLKLAIPLPPFAEQRRIATILGTWDAAISSSERLIGAKQKLKEGLMQLLLKGRIKFRDRQSLGWTENRFGEIFEMSSGSTPSRTRPDFFEGGVPWITSGELNYNTILDSKEKISEEAVRSANLKIFPQGSFVIAITGLEAEGTRGRCGILGRPATVSQSCMVFSQSPKVDTHFLFYYYLLFGDKIAFSLAQGTKQQSLPRKILSLARIIYPLDLDEQKRIVNVLQACDVELVCLARKLAALRQQKKGLMQQLLTGKARVKVP